MAFNNNDLYQQILGSIMKEPTLLMNLPSPIVTEDFSEENKIARLIFFVVTNLIGDGVVKIEIKTIEAYLQDYINFNQIYYRNNGREYCKLCYDKGEPENFQVFYTKLKKTSLLRDLYIHGYDVSLYNYEAAAEKGMREEQECILRFESATESDILGHVENSLAALRSRHTKGLSGYITASTGLAEYVQSLKESPEIGQPLNGDLYNSIVGGAARGKLYLRSGGTNVGKALPNYTKIPLFNGTWKQVDEVEVGDELIGSDGKPTKVLKVHPQENKKEIYKVVFSDGHSAECCEEHLWGYYENAIDDKKLCVATTKQLFEKKSEGKFKCRFSIPTVAAVDYEKKDYKISPYLVGSLTVRHFGKTFSNEYFIGSIEQRYELLSGILDLKVDVIKNSNSLFFSTSSREVAAQIEQLSRSLGYGVTINQLYPGYEITLWNCKTNYRMNIIDIQPTRVTSEMTCFTVDAPDALFCMDNYTLTHNTRWSVFDACKIVYPIYFDKKLNTFIWEKDKIPQKVLFVTTEMKPQEIQTIILAYVSGVEEQHIKRGACSREEEERIEKAMMIIDKYDSYFFLESIENPDLNNVQNAIKRHILLNDVEYIFYDYIFTSPALLQQFTSSGAREDVVLMMMANQLKEIAAKYNVFIATSTQVNGDGLRIGEKRDQRVLRGSKAIADKADCGCIIAKVTPEELEQIQPCVKKFGAPTHVTDIYKLRSGNRKGSRIWSRIDLGTGYKEDLFLTDENNVYTDLSEYEKLAPFPRESVWISQEFLNKI